MSEVESRAVSETPMCAAEVMAKAVYEYWRSKQPEADEILPWEDTEAEDRVDSTASMRDSLRALAAMEPTLPVIEEGYSAWVRTHSGEDSSEGAYISGCKAYILAAAAEGEQK
jgi:hypothetical protein